MLYNCYPISFDNLKSNMKNIRSRQVALSAVVITLDKRLAIFQYAKSKTLQHIALNEAIDGWILTEVHERYVVLKKGDNTKTLELEIKGSPQKKMPEKTRHVGG